MVFVIGIILGFFVIMFIDFFVDIPKKFWEMVDKWEKK